MQIFVVYRKPAFSCHLNSFGVQLLFLIFSLTEFDVKSFIV